jgi:DNA-binding winged helix-turn-helix (wHTH) protein
VWDAYGQEASNNSLNQYLSVLRKAFRNVGLEHEIIITVPKQGFLIKVNVDYDEEDVSTLSEQSFTYVKPEPEPLDTITSPNDVEITGKQYFMMTVVRMRYQNKTALLLIKNIIFLMLF